MEEIIRISSSNDDLFDARVLQKLPQGFSPIDVALPEKSVMIRGTTKDSEIQELLEKLGFQWLYTGRNESNLFSYYSRGRQVFKIIKHGNGKEVFQCGCILWSEAQDAKKTIGEISQAFLPLAPTVNEENKIRMTMSYRDSEGNTRTTSRIIACPTWDGIQTNYPTHSRKAISDLMLDENPVLKGRIVIWHGRPGTGKTYALRALVNAWRKKYVPVVVSDPEHFSSKPSYYYDLIDHVSDYDETGNQVEKPMILIMEDTADLILLGNRATHFDKVGKLLNMSDGLLGQGRDDIMVFTFNEKIEEIDPAFLRPGRCIMTHEFQTFTAAEAKEWLGGRGKSLEGRHGDYTLAELYGMTR